MQNVRLFWNGQLLDYYGGDDGSLPLKLSRVVDDWQNFIGAIGTRNASLGQSLEIPASKNNCLALFDSENPASINLEAHILRGNLTVEAGSQVLFYGQAQLSSVVYERQAIVRGFSITIEGDATDLFSSLNEKLLFNLELGTAATTADEIEDSRASTTILDTDNIVYYPLVNYGGRMLSPNYPQEDYSDYENSPRPALRLWLVLQGMFAEAGYSLAGDAFLNNGFRNILIPFGVGDDWERADNFQDYKLKLGSLLPGGIPQVTNDGDVVAFLDNSPPYFDGMGLGSGGFFNALTTTASSGAWFQFEFYFSSTAGEVVYDIIIDKGGGATNVFISGLTEGQVHRPDPIWFGLDHRETMRVRVRNIGSPGVPVNIPPDAYYSAEMLPRFQYPAPLRVASCLRRDKCTEFIKGVQHALGLVLNVDNVLKRVTIEHRFLDDLGETRPNYVQNFTKSYYKQESECTTLDVDSSSAQISYKKPFGNGLNTFFAEDDSDVIYKLYLEQLGQRFNADKIPLYGYSKQLADINRPYNEQRNPYFAPTINSKFSGTAAPTLQNNLYYPTLIDDLELVKFENLDYFTGKKASYKTGKSRLLMCYGVMDFSGIGNLTNQRAYKKPYEAVQLTYKIPSAFQLYPDHPDYFAATASVPYNLTFPTYRYNYAPTDKVSGLIDKFYQKYLAITQNDKTVTVRARVRVNDFNQADFRRPVRVRLHGQWVRCWIIGIDDFAPLQDEFCSVTLLVDTDKIADLDLGQTDNPLRPVLLVTIETKIVEDGNLL